MTDKKISQLTNLTGADLADVDEFAVVDASATETKAITFGELKSALDTATGFVRITGDTMTGALDVQSTITADGLTVDGDISATGGDLDLDTLDLNAIAASKAVTAVDVFVYDTSKDSDGGAWRKRTQHTSWYNETLNTATRGSRREFPAVAVIVAESDKITIYDGDDPSLPMWMVFNAGSFNMLGSSASVSSVVAFNGIVAVAKTTSGVRPISFIADNFTYYSNDAFQGSSVRNIADRNSGAVTVSFDAAFTIVNSTVNDVAMTVLPNAPVDPATGLPVPTIAVATDGGVSVIKDDGTVVDSSLTASASSVHFDQYYRVRWIANLQLGCSAPPPLSDGFGYQSPSDPSLNGSIQASYATLSQGGLLYAPTVENALRTQKGLLLHDPVRGSSTILQALLTSTYNTGWMNGDIKGAFLADTDDTDLVGSGELVTNGTFDTDLSNWLQNGSGDITITWNASGYMEIARGSGGIAGHPYQGFTTVIGTRYRISAKSVGGSSNLFFAIGTSIGGTQYGGASVTSGVNQVFEFVATGTTAYVSFWPTGTSATAFADDVTCETADADRSVNNNGLIVNGTVTRSPVATGAELVAYSGFSASNYLEQPYNSALDFGTGDFSVMGWANRGTGNGGYLFERGTIGTTADIISVYLSNNLALFYAGATGSQYIAKSITTAENKWYHIVALRKAGVIYYYLDGKLIDQLVSNVSVTNPTAVSRVGLRTAISLPYEGSLALLRISATAPTAEQIKKIYEDEKVLFQENAACTLYGASDAVTALAHDPVTDLLHVGTSAGRSVFSGLRRVSNTTTAVGTAISASNGLVAEE